MNTCETLHVPGNTYCVYVGSRFRGKFFFPIFFFIFCPEFHIPKYESFLSAICPRLKGYVLYCNMKNVLCANLRNIFFREKYFFMFFVLKMQVFVCILLIFIQKYIKIKICFTPASIILLPILKNRLSIKLI